MFNTKKVIGNIIGDKHSKNNMLFHVVEGSDHYNQLYMTAKQTNLSPKDYVKQQKYGKGRWINSMLWDNGEIVLGFGTDLTQVKNMVHKRWHSQL